jgi:hypothetical protein
MPHWLAEARTVQDSAPFKRFSPAYWTVNFPRPMMASVVTTAADALRVDAVFYGSGDLAGLRLITTTRIAACGFTGAARGSCRSTRSTARP